MNPQLYQLLHLAGVLVLFLSLGALLSGPSKRAGIAHGIALLVILVTGFGRMAKLKYDFDAWLIIKLVVWLLLGASLVVLKRGLLPKPAAAVVVTILGAVAVWSAIFKPGIAAAAE